MIVIDTNIVLDAFVFDDASTAALKTALAQQAVAWLATQPMRDELEATMVVAGVPDVRGIDRRALA